MCCYKLILGKVTCYDTCDLQSCNPDRVKKEKNIAYFVQENCGDEEVIKISVDKYSCTGDNEIRRIRISVQKIK